MKFLMMAALAASILHPVPKQADNPNSSNHDAQPQASPATVNQTPLARPSPPQEQKSADIETNQSNWGERILKPLVDNWPVLAVAIWGIIVAGNTLKAINKQAELMDGQLKEMQGTKTLMDKQGEYIVNTERAWVMSELGWYEKKGPNIVESVVNGAESTTVFAKLICKNEGKSPAWIDCVYARLEIASSRSMRDEADRESLDNNGRWGPLGVGEERSRGVQMRCSGRRKEKEFLSALVIVEYSDIFGIKRETILGYSIDANGDMYRQDGLPERNQNT